MALAALVSVGCSGGGGDANFTEGNDGGEGASTGAGASGGTKGGRGGSDPGGSSSGGSDGVGSGGSGLAGSGGSSACHLADLESCDSADALCCPGPSGGECIPSSMQSCGACHAMCSPVTADACVDRACVCGSGPTCSGDAPFCHQGHCAECRGDSDCSDSPGGSECVVGACSACDPADDSGCSGSTPICSADLECVGCSEQNPCGPFLLCDEDSGRCVGCLEDADCTSPSAPVCVEAGGSGTECQPCSSDTECLALDPDHAQCLSSGKCSACDPDDEASCSPDVCVPDGNDGYHCAECSEHTHCSDPEKPLCETEQTCVPCNHSGIELPDLGCFEDNGGNPAVCITGGDKAGQCGPCDPATNAGCPSSFPFCDADFECKGCLDDDDCPNGVCHEYGPAQNDFKECWGCEDATDCPSGKVCSAGNACVNCGSDADCVGNAAGPECVFGSCRECDPAGNAGCSGEKDTCHNGIFACVECMSGSHCPPGQGCSNFDCTECASDGECAGNSAGTQCVQVTPGNFECHLCDPLDNSGCYNASAPHCNPATLSCVQ